MAIVEMLGTAATGILKNLSSVVGQHIGTAWGMEDELKKLKDKLEMIEAVTHDAEKQQVTDAAVGLWLRWLKDVAYDADDVLDRFSYEAMRRELKGNQRDKVRVSLRSLGNSHAIFRFKMSRKIKSINKRLEEITKTMVKFNLESTDSRRSDHDLYTERQNRMTASLVHVSDIIGRENDRSLVVKMLLMKNPSSSSLPSSSNDFIPQEKISVMSIVGMGGLGKTTLAQLVYKDELIDSNFELKMWVCVSNNFDIFQILKCILESITEEKCAEVSNVHVLVKTLHNKITGKKYFLVLDDVWNENAEDWDKLRCLLSPGAQGSRILVTTRNEIVASIVGGVLPPFNLTTLSAQECWSIIKNKAFSPGGAVETPNMTYIGEEIAIKCAGLPLAAIFLGSLMRLKRKESEWLEIRDNNIFNTPESPNRLIQILKLSYDNLPSHLKQCFSYCCLFPKAWKFNRETLIGMWMAEGFLQPSKGTNQTSLEDIGDGYFISLLSNSFFQDVGKDLFGEIKTFKMHDLVHDLAQSVGSREVTILNAVEIKNSVSEIHRLCFIIEKKLSGAVSHVLSHAKKVRTIFCQEKKGFLDLSPLTNQGLRVICLLGVRSLQLPSSRFQLKHLRYLDLSQSRIGRVHAASLCELYNLQTLILSGCKKVGSILKVIGSLKLLRHINLSDSDVRVLPDSIVTLVYLQILDISGCDISILPANIGSLQQLRSLDISCTGVKELPDSITSIYCLRSLKFYFCQQLKALPSSFGELTRSRSLDLSMTRITELPESSSNLCSLELVNLGYTCRYPRNIMNWVQLRSFIYSGDTRDAVMPRGIEMLTLLEVLKPYLVRKQEAFNVISSSSGIEELAVLNYLRQLEISYLENVRGQIDAESAKLKDKKNIEELCLRWKRRSGDCTVLEGLQPHSNLRGLRIDGFSGLQLPKWMMVSPCCLPNLVELYLENLGGCIQLPALGLIPCLKVLFISKMYHVERLGEEFYYHQEEAEENICSTTSLFPSLIELKIEALNQLKQWVGLPLPYKCFPCIQILRIISCHVLASLPDLRLWTSLRNVTIMDCRGIVKSMPYVNDLESLNFLDSLKLDFLDQQRGGPDLEDRLKNLMVAHRRQQNHLMKTMKMEEDDAKKVPRRDRHVQKYMELKDEDEEKQKQDVPETRKFKKNVERWMKLIEYEEKNEVHEEEDNETDELKRMHLRKNRTLSRLFELYDEEKEEEEGKDESDDDEEEGQEKIYRMMQVYIPKDPNRA